MTFAQLLFVSLLWKPLIPYIPQLEWLHIYIDGSLLDFTQGSGVGVFCDLFSFYSHVGSHMTHDGETEAFHQLSAPLSTPDKAVILSDPSSALQALASNQNKHGSRVQNYRELLSRILTKVVIQWMPSHCGLWGNEMADILAKRGTDILLKSTTDLPLHSVKLKIKRIYKKCVRDAATSAAKNKSEGANKTCVSDSPHAAPVTEFRLLTGHDCLCAHLYHFNMTDSLCMLLDK
ncbi:uncharacterized protein TNCV_1132461 [Trichonephila clavipes]|nr:uncharacterized protein TNCV_1132461 [Trichonephila clavipes]